MIAIWIETIPLGRRDSKLGQQLWKVKEPKVLSVLSAETTMYHLQPGSGIIKY